MTTVHNFNPKPLSSQTTFNHEPLSPKTTFIPNHFHPNHLDTFIPNHFRPKPLSSQTLSSQIHFQPKPLSSQTPFVPNPFRPKPLSSQTPFVPNPVPFVPNPFRPKPLSSQTPFVPNPFRPTTSTSISRFVFVENPSPAFGPNPLRRFVTKKSTCFCELFCLCNPCRLFFCCFYFVHLNIFSS